jgi:hypothetical protein
VGDFSRHFVLSLPTISTIHFRILVTMDQITYLRPLSPETIHRRRAILKPHLDLSAYKLRRRAQPQLAPPPAIMPLKQRKAKRGSQVSKDAWKTFQKAKVPVLAVPPEIHLKIFGGLHRVDAVCLSIVK